MSGRGGRVWGSGVWGRGARAPPAALLTPRIAFQVHPFQRETLQVPGVREGLLPVQDPGGPQNPTHAGEPALPRPLNACAAGAVPARPGPARLGSAWPAAGQGRWPPGEQGSGAEGKRGGGGGPALDGPVGPRGNSGP